jgi:4-hydroxy-tetrahydrodipicolinate synthase
LRTYGCDGFVACGTNGEAASLSVAERMTVLETTLAQADGLPVIAGTGASALPDAITLTRHAFRAGVEAVLVVPPFFFKRPAEAGLAAWFQRLCDAAVPPGGRVLLYHIPQTTAIPFTDSLLRTLLASHPGAIYGIKDSTGDPAQGSQIRAAFPGLAYFCGNDHLVGPACGDGAAGSITAAANVFPDLVKAAQRSRAGRNGPVGDRAAATADQGKLDQVRSLLERYPLQPATKALLVELAGLPPVAVRPPQVELNAVQREELLGGLAENLPQWRCTQVAG